MLIIDSLCFELFALMKPSLRTIDPDVLQVFPLRIFWEEKQIQNHVTEV